MKRFLSMLIVTAFLGVSTIASTFASGAAPAAAPVAAVPPPPPSGPPSDTGADPSGPRWTDRLYFGGGIGASFGDVDYLSINPLIGYSFTPKVSAGLALFYVHRDDSRYEPDLTTNDYGFDLFGRYSVAPPIFLQAQYSHWNYEVLQFNGTTARDSYSAYLAGGGFAQPIGNRAAFYVSLLYDFNYSDSSPSPYNDPWVISAGVTVGF